MTCNCLGGVRWYGGGFTLPSSGYWLGLSRTKPFVFTTTAENSAPLNEEGKADL